MFKLFSCQKYRRTEILADNSCFKTNLIGDISYFNFKPLKLVFETISDGSSTMFHF